MARNFERSSNIVFKKLRTYGQDSSAFYIHHDTFIVKGQEEFIKPLKKVNKNDVEEAKEVEREKVMGPGCTAKAIRSGEASISINSQIEPEIHSREETPEDEEILVGGALMTTKAIGVRNKALAQKTKYKTIRKIDLQNETSNETNNENHFKEESVSQEVPSVKSPAKIHYGKLKTIDQLDIFVPEDRKGYKYVEKPGLCCSVS